MNVVRWYIKNDIKERYPDVEVKHTYGAYTKASRRDLGQLPKTHANDAYAMGEFHPKHRCTETHYIKRRRNNRVLTKFYDAVYIDKRDGTRKKGSEIGCNRTDRSIPRSNPNNERMHRGARLSKGRASIRTGHHSYQAGDIVLYKGKRYEVKTTRFKQSKKLGDYETAEFKPSSTQHKIAEVKSIRRIGGWQSI